MKSISGHLNPLRLAALLGVILVALPSVQAQTVGDLSILPTRANFDDSTRMANFTILNRGVKPIRYRLTLIDMDMSPDGSLQKSNSAHSQSAAALLRFAPHEISLAPGEWQKVKVVVQMPEGLPEGEYRSHLALNPIAEVTDAPVASQDTKGLKIQLRMQTAITLPLIFKHGNLKATSTLSGLAFVDNAGTKSLSFRISREGTATVRGDCRAWFVAPNGTKTEIAKILELPVYFPNGYRNVNMPLNLADIPGPKGTLIVEYKIPNQAAEHIECPFSKGS